MLRKIAIALAVLVLAFVIVVALQPAEFRVERSATVSAPPPVVFEHVNDLHHWTAWSPWEQRDPGMRRSYGGAPAGAGATYAWAGNEEVGEGRMTITESRPSERIELRLEFLEPFPASNDVAFRFEPQGEGTVVTWSMTGQNGFMGKAIDLFMNMDAMVGGDFEKGLAALGSVAEAGPPS